MNIFSIRSLSINERLIFAISNICLFLYFSQTLIRFYQLIILLSIFFLLTHFQFWKLLLIIFVTSLFIFLSNIFFIKYGKIIFKYYIFQITDFGLITGIDRSFLLISIFLLSRILFLDLKETININNYSSKYFNFVSLFHYPLIIYFDLLQFSKKNTKLNYKSFFIKVRNYFLDKKDSIEINKVSNKKIVNIKNTHKNKIKKLFKFMIQYIFFCGWQILCLFFKK